jgi:hypothetical protein
MRSDASTQFDALTAAGATAGATVFVQSTASPGLRIIAAKVNNGVVTVDNAGAVSKVALSFPQSQVYVLSLALAGLQPHDDVTLTEDCGTSNVLKTKLAGAGHGGADAVVAFDIFAS